MASLNIGSSSDLTVEMWEEKSYREALKETFFQKFMSESGDSIVHLQRKLEKNRGDQVFYHLHERMTGNLITGDNTLEGNEDTLTTASDSITLEAYRFAGRYNALLTAQRAVFDVAKENERAVKARITEGIDNLIFSALRDRAPSTVFHLASGTLTAQATAATAKTNLTATDLITPTLIRATKSYAVSGGESSDDRVIPPLTPVMVDGKKHYVLLVHPDVAYDMKENSEYAQSIREAQMRGDSNPLFSGSVAMIDGVIIHEHENVHIAADAGSGGNVAYSECFFLGAQALLLAVGEKPKLISDSFDYGKEIGIGMEMILKAQKPQFTFKGTASIDFGSLGVYVARTNIAGLRA
jgi:N4-gp56 family major capsid protein